MEIIVYYNNRRFANGGEFTGMAPNYVTTWRLVGELSIQSTQFRLHPNEQVPFIGRAKLHADVQKTHRHRNKGGSLSLVSMQFANVMTFARSLVTFNIASFR